MRSASDSRNIHGNHTPFIKRSNPELYRHKTLTAFFLNRDAYPSSICCLVATFVNAYMQFNYICGDRFVD